MSSRPHLQCSQPPAPSLKKTPQRHPSPRCPTCQCCKRWRSTSPPTLYLSPRLRALQKPTSESGTPGRMPCPTQLGPRRTPRAGKAMPSRPLAHFPRLRKLHCSFCYTPTSTRPSLRYPPLVSNCTPPRRPMRGRSWLKGNFRTRPRLLMTALRRPSSGSRVDAQQWVRRCGERCPRTRAQAPLGLKRACDRRCSSRSTEWMGRVQGRSRQQQQGLTTRTTPPSTCSCPTCVPPSPPCSSRGLRPGRPPLRRRRVIRTKPRLRTCLATPPVSTRPSQR
mmetsp:Transcript_10303/g.31646  ORF Transcript_10303/g.31646 Transcript_10303/m.31646 type:complete len:278 (+) Transcript_10303:447-1280(+)